MPTLTLDNFSGGMDRRIRFAGRRRDRFRLLQNAFVANGGRRIYRRYPIKQQEGAFDPEALGLVPKNSQLYSLVPRGTAPALATGVTALYFDPPFGASANVLKEVGALGNTIVAIVAHTIAGSVRYFLHVFDNAPDLPTYVLDPWWPWAHEIDPTVRPVMAEAVSKLWVPDKNGDTRRSGVNRPRVWNEYAPDDYVKRGHEFHLYCPAAGSYTFTIPLDYKQIDVASYGLMAGFLAWVVEKYTGTGTPDYTVDGNWTTRMAEVSGAPAAGQVQFQSTPNTSTGATYANWISLTINATAAGWHRARFLPPRDGVTQQVNNFVLLGAWTPRNVGGSASYYFFGDGATKQFRIQGSRYFIGTIAATVDGGAAAHTLAADSDHQIQVNFTAAPANGGLIHVTQSATDATHIWIAPGTVRTLAGDVNWAGGEGPSTAPFGYHFYFLTLDTNGLPTGVTEIAPGTFITGKFLYESLYLGTIQKTGFGDSYFTPVWTSDKLTSDQGVDPVNTYQTRNAIADGKLYAAAIALAGGDDAGLIPSSAHNNGGGTVAAISGLEDRLLIIYPAAAELWEVHEDPALDRFLSSGPVGAGTQAQPHGAPLSGAIMMPTSTGLRGISVTGQLKDSLTERDIGDPVRGLGVPQFQTAAFWPDRGHYIAALTLGGEFRFLTLAYSAADKLSAWADYTVAGLTSVDYQAMAAVGDRLYMRSGAHLYYFDASPIADLDAGIAPSVTFRDFGDAATAYQSVAEWHPLDCDRPGMGKQYDTFDVWTVGTCASSFSYNDNGVEQSLDGPVFDGISFGSPTCGLAMHGQTIAPKLTSTDETGWTVDVLAIGFQYTER